MMRRAAILVMLCAAVIAPGAQNQDTVRAIKITAERFAFSPSKIDLAPGEEVDIHLTSDDTSHGFRIDGTDIDVEIPKRGRGEVVVRFKAAGEGPYKFECSRMCGAGHHFMRGEIAVKRKDAK